jgi:hypothetical protein
MLKLSRKWADYLRSQPETGMGYQVVTIRTRQGSVYRQAIVDSGHVTRIRNLREIPFTEEDIEQIIVTHDKWDWKNES